MNAQLRYHLIRGLIGFTIVAAALTLTDRFKAYASVLHILIWIAPGIALMLTLQNLPAYKPYLIVGLIFILLIAGTMLVGLILGRIR